jgi:glutathione S-transferase
VGDTCTYADLSFVTWAYLGYGLLKQLNKSEEIEKYEKYTAWMKSLESRETVKKVLDSIAKGRAEHGLP